MIEPRRQIQAILEDPLGREWSLQGFGMLRTYLTDDKSQRLHVWHGDHRVEDVSELHTHPWDMRSTIIAGELRQERFFADRDTDSPTHMEQKILCGEGGGLCGLPQPVALVGETPEFYEEGDTYEQGWREIHQSRPRDGTVTLVERVFTDDPDHAYVYWPYGKEWVSAEPRVATTEEVLAITGHALKVWF